jgi:adenylate cyclase class IV
MKREFELKAVLTGEEAEFRARLSRAGWRLSFEGTMSDRRLDTPDRVLEDRDVVLRLRSMRARSGETRTSLCWKGPASEEDGYKVRAEVETTVGDAVVAAEIMGRLSYTETTLALDREIAVFAKGGVWARIERYPAMDTLIELEGDPADVEACIEELGLPREAWKPWPLGVFIQQYEERTGGAARLCEEDHRG